PRHSPAHQLHAAVEVLDDGRAAVHPVATVDVHDAVDALDGGRVDMPANHAVQPAVLYAAHDAFLEVRDEAHGGLHLVLCIARERPIAGDSERSSHPGQNHVEADEESIGLIAEYREPLVVFGHDIELVTVQQKVAAAVGSGVDVLTMHGDVAEGAA